MAQSQRMSGFVKRYGKQVDTVSHAPDFRIVQMHIPGHGLGIRRPWVKRVRQAGHGREWVSIAMASDGEEDLDSPAAPRLQSRCKADVGVARPFG